MLEDMGNGIFMMRGRAVWYAAFALYAAVLQTLPALASAPRTRAVAAGAH